MKGAVINVHPQNSRANGENWLFLQFMQNLDGALTPGHVSTVGEANESYVRCPGLLSDASSSQESNETHSCHHIEGITLNGPLCSPRLRYWS